MSPAVAVELARLTLRFAGRDLPETDQEADELISALREALQAREADPSDDCPF